MKIGILVIIIVLFLYQTVLSVLEKRSESRPTPANVADVYDAETYERWKRYHGEMMRVGNLGSAAGLLLNLILFGTNVFASFAALFPANDYLRMFSVILLASAADLVMLPFSWYSTMVIDEKYGFNRSTNAIFAADTVKEFLLGMLMNLGLGAVLILLHHWLGNWVGVLFAGVLILFALVMGFLAPYFTRIFNKFEPLAEGSLRTKLSALLEKNGYHVKEIEVMDASTRSAKLNAYFTGFGHTKTIVLYDTLLERMSEDEICAVFAHEMGHGIHKDTLKMQFFSFFQLFLLAMILWMNLVVPAFWTDFGFKTLNYGFAMLLVFSVESQLLEPLMGLLSNTIARKAEYRADAQAVKEGYGDALIGALKTLARENFADLSPDPLLVKLEDNHPTLSDRIRAIEMKRMQPGE